jgi:hypothetical protein
MKCQLRWGNEAKTIILMELQAGWEWLDIYTAADGYLAMMNAVPHRVSLIIYSTEQPIRVPPNALANMRLLMAFTHPREDKMVIVGDVPVIRPILQTIKHVFGLRRVVENVEFADTLDEAYARLQKREVAKNKS